MSSNENIINCAPSAIQPLPTPLQVRFHTPIPCMSFCHIFDQTPTAFFLKYTNHISVLIRKCIYSTCIKFHRLLICCFQVKKCHFWLWLVSWCTLRWYRGRRSFSGKNTDTSANRKEKLLWDKVQCENFTEHLYPKSWIKFHSTDSMSMYDIWSTNWADWRSSKNILTLFERPKKTRVLELAPFLLVLLSRSMPNQAL